MKCCLYFRFNRLKFSIYPGRLYDILMITLGLSVDFKAIALKMLMNFEMSKQDFKF